MGLVISFLVTAVAIDKQHQHGFLFTNGQYWSIRVLNLGFGFKTKPSPFPLPGKNVCLTVKPHNSLYLPHFCKTKITQF